MNPSISALEKAIKQKKISEASLIFLHELASNELKFVIELRKEGVLRCSKYEFEFKVIESLVRIGQKQKLLYESTRKYFESIESLSYIARDIHKIHSELLKETEKENFKNYLVSVDSLFWQMDDSFEFETKIPNKLNKEEITIAFSSYFYYLFNSPQNCNIKLNSLVDVKRIRSKFFLDNLTEFYKTLQFKEWEILVDKFEYTISKINSKNNQIVLESPNIDIEKAISLGYINCQLDEISHSMNHLIYEDSETLLLTKFATDFAMKHKDKLFEIKNSPVKRIIFKIPLTKELIDFLKRDEVFLEEMSTISFLQKALLIDLDKIKNVEICSGLCLFDVLKLQRLFAFLFLCFNAYIDSENLRKSKLFWRSILPVFTSDELHNLLSTFFGEQKSIQMIELLTWKSTSKIRFDIQTLPLINKGNEFILPLGILAGSNLFRNILQSTGFRFDANSSSDPIGNILQDVFSPVSSFFKTNVGYSFNGEEGDIDVITVIDGNTFIFECKNSLHPTNPFEMRTSYNYIETGASQLNKITGLWNTSGFIEYLRKKLGYEIPSNLCRAIVTGNQIFSGLRNDGYAVRYLHELCNIVRTGKISIKVTSLDEKVTRSVDFKIWQSDTFTSQDLVEYIEKDSIHQCYFNAMISREIKVQIKNTSLTRKTYALNLEKLCQEFESKFKSEYS